MSDETRAIAVQQSRETNGVVDGDLRGAVNGFDAPQSFGWGCHRNYDLAAHEIARGVMSKKQIAELVGVYPPQLSRWLARPQFRSRVDEIKQELRRELHRSGVGEIIARVHAYDEIVDKLRTVVSERAGQATADRAKCRSLEAEADGLEAVGELVEARRLRRQAKELEPAPGAETGLLTKQQRRIGRGDQAETIQEWSLDAALIKELREVSKLASQDLGQWKESTPGATPSIEIKAYIGIEFEKV